MRPAPRRGLRPALPGGNSRRRGSPDAADPQRPGSGRGTPPPRVRSSGQHSLKAVTKGFWSLQHRPGTPVLLDAGHVGTDRYQRRESQHAALIRGVRKRRVVGAQRLCRRRPPAHGCNDAAHRQISGRAGRGHPVLDERPRPLSNAARWCFAIGEDGVGGQHRPRSAVVVRRVGATRSVRPSPGRPASRA